MITSRCFENNFNFWCVIGGGVVGINCVGLFAPLRGSK